MKWVNNNKNNYRIRVIKSLSIIFIFTLVMECLVLFTNEDLFYDSLSLIIIGVVVLPSIILWPKRAKYNIQTIEVDRSDMEIYYLEYNSEKFIKSDVNKIKIEMWGRHHGGVYITIHINEQLILKQEDFYWESNITLKELHAELKKILPYKTVLPAL